MISSYRWNLKYDTNELIYENRLIDIEKRLVVPKAGEVRKGWMESLGSADANYYI